MVAADGVPDEIARRTLERFGRIDILVNSAALVRPANVRNGADVLTNALRTRKEKSALHLSKYVTDASKNLARSKGRLALAGSAERVSRVRANVWPETGSYVIDLEVKLDDSGRVEAMHARLAMLLGLPDA